MRHHLHPGMPSLRRVLPSRLRLPSVRAPESLVPCQFVRRGAQSRPSVARSAASIGYRLRIAPRMLQTLLGVNCAHLCFRGTAMHTHLPVSSLFSTAP